MVHARRSFAGQLPLSALSRLASSLAATPGEVTFELDFGKDEFGVAGVHVRAAAVLPLLCQRTLEQFDFPVHIDARLGFLVSEDEEAALPAGYEPLLLDAAGLRPADVIEDELLLALPLVPTKPGTRAVEREWTRAGREEQVAARPNPFAVLKKVTF
jgi:uncharacterized protein